MEGVHVTVGTWQLMVLGAVFGQLSYESGNATGAGTHAGLVQTALSIRATTGSVVLKVAGKPGHDLHVHEAPVRITPVTKYEAGYTRRFSSSVGLAFNLPPDGCEPNRASTPREPTMTPRLPIPWSLAFSTVVQGARFPDSHFEDFALRAYRQAHGLRSVRKPGGLSLPLWRGEQSPEVLVQGVASGDDGPTPVNEVRRRVLPSRVRAVEQVRIPQDLAIPRGPGGQLRADLIGMSAVPHADKLSLVPAVDHSVIGQQ